MHSVVSDEMILMGTYPVFWLANVKWSPDEMNRVVRSTWSTLLADSGRCGCFTIVVSSLNQEGAKHYSHLKLKTRKRGKFRHAYLTHGALETLGPYIHMFQDAEARHCLHII